jgi:hypothetical protein
MFFFPTMFWDDFQCGCGGQTFSLLSKDTIWNLSNPDNLNLNILLPINDTLQFKTQTFNYNGYISCAYCPSFTNPCPLCYSNWTPPKVKWFLGKTNEHKYFLFKYVSSNPVKDSLSQKSYLVTKIHYIVQTDGSLDFSGANVTAVKKVWTNQHFNKSNKQIITTKINGYFSPNDKVYDIRGQRVKISGNNNLRKREAFKLYIIYTNDQSVK